VTTTLPRDCRRVVVHFPGFEPLDAQAHHARYAYSATQSAAAFGFAVETKDLNTTGDGPRIDVFAKGPNWSTRSSIYLLGHQEIIAGLKRAPIHKRITDGFSAAADTLAEGAFFRYLKVAWRFALFFLFPFLAMAVGLLAFGFIATAPLIFGTTPWNLLWSVPLSIGFFAVIFLPWAERAYILHLFAHWQLAIKLSRLDDEEVRALLESHMAALKTALEQPADEYLITSHSLGGAFAIHALGELIERHPDFLRGKPVFLATLAGPGLQSSLMNSAIVLRRRIRSVLVHPDVFWLDVQCLADIVNFYQGKVARDNGFADLAEPAVKQIRMKDMLHPERYRRIKWDSLRLHRQFILGSDLPTHYDFTLLTAGPFTVREIAGFVPGFLPPMSADGAFFLP
jgi:hypothetical protein